tara:strand:+ start:204 stop:656 length:453 start_codon:yes stop_codon:yes gene_type:complete
MHREYQDLKHQQSKVQDYAYDYGYGDDQQEADSCFVVEIVVDEVCIRFYGLGDVALQLIRSLRSMQKMLLRFYALYISLMENGAECQNRTDDNSLENCSFAIKLIPRFFYLAFLLAGDLVVAFLATDGLAVTLLFADARFGFACVTLSVI